MAKIKSDEQDTNQSTAKAWLIAKQATRINRVACFYIFD